MRTSIDFPDSLFRHLKAQAALQGMSLKDLVLGLIEKGLQAPQLPLSNPVNELPTIRLGHPLAMPHAQLSNAGLSDLLAQEP